MFLRKVKYSTERLHEGYFPHQKHNWPIHSVFKLQVFQLLIYVTLVFQTLSINSLRRMCTIPRKFIKITAVKHKSSFPPVSGQ